MSATRWGAAAGLLRPGAEAVLLAGVAIGCAQIGWRIASPDLPDMLIGGGGHAPGGVEVAHELRSPFAPLSDAATSDRTPHADVSGIRLVGLRMSTEPEYSGAVLILGDGVQRSFLVGYEIADGVTLEEVATDHVVLSLGDAEETLMLENATPARPSLALALLGVPQQQTPSAPQPIQTAWTPDGSAQTVSMAADARAEASRWLFSTAGHVEMRNGVRYAWRADSAFPEAGIDAGDLILSVNGVGPADGQAKLLSAARGPITLLVERRSGERAQLSLPSGVIQ
ncbi:MAG: type II secretion system protein N [Hyphomonadaceae bacterium]